MEEWKEYKLEDTSIEMIDGDRGKNYPKNNDFLSDGYCLFLNAGNVTKDGFSFSDKSFITQEKDDELRKGRLEKYDVVITTRGTVGNVALYDNKVPFEHIRINSGMLILKSGKDILSEYLYYYLKGKKFQSQISLFVSGSAQPQLPKSTLGKMSISYPNNKDTQNKIVSILKSLDDKIEVNRKINENLEQQAQALFKSWFVDFEPFKDGEFVESELGMIPKGWRVGALEEIGEVIGGSTPSKAKPEYYTKNGIAWLTPKDLSVSNAKFTAKGEIDITQEGYNSCSTKIMPKGTVLFSSRAPIGYITIAKNEICTNQGFKSVVPGYAGTAFIYCYLKAATPDIENKATGSTFKEASGSLMKSLQLVIAPKDIMDSFEECLKPLFAEQECIEDESRRLATLRDTLLPKLMSGEVKVNEIEI